jgi:UDP-glucuronate 4-epimerase
LADALLRRGDNVVAVDNFDSYYDPAIKRRNVSWALEQDGYSLVEGDVRSCGFLRDVFDLGPFQSVAHLAARAGVRPSIDQPLLYESVNMLGTISLLEACRCRGCPQLVFGSSSSVYGASSRAPFREDDIADRPCSPYAATKRAGEMACYSYHHLYGLDITCLRFFTVYGPRQRPEMAIHKFVRLIDQGMPVELYGDGSSKRDYTYVDDIVQGVLAAIDNAGGYRTYNLGTTVLTCLDDLAHMIAERLGKPLLIKPLPDQPGDVPLTHADISRAELELGYKPATPLPVGLDRFVAWYLDHFGS